MSNDTLDVPPPKKSKPKAKPKKDPERDAALKEQRAAAKKAAKKAKGRKARPDHPRDAGPPILDPFRHVKD